MDVALNQNVAVEVTQAPTNAAARKTLERLFRKDPEVARKHRRQQRLRPSWQTKRRGGRLWHHQMKSPAPVPIVCGARCAIFATVDVVRDLSSVERFVKVTPA
jgi:hypothetical protein